MKKITLLLLLIISPIFVLAQTTWDFNSTDDAWTTAAATPANGASSITLTTNGGTNPTFSQAAANVDATNNKWAVITLKNGVGGPTFLRVSYPNGSGGRVYKPTIISNGDTTFKTYYVDLTNTFWTGTVNDLKLHFKDDNATTGGADHISTGVAIEIDKIVIAQYPEKYVYDFNVNANMESWSTVDATAVVSSGNITITPTAGLSSKIKQDLFSVNATNNTYVHITYRNMSALNNQIRFQFKSSGDAYATLKGKNIAINQSMAGYEVVSINMSTLPEWTGTAKDFQVVIRDTNNANNASAGDLIIDNITINNNATLSSPDFNRNVFASIYPNPATNVLNFSSQETISNAVIYNLNGQEVYSNKNIINNSINVESLSEGIYFIKLVSNENVNTLKFIKK